VEVLRLVIVQASVDISELITIITETREPTFDGLVQASVDISELITIITETREPTFDGLVHSIGNGMYLFD